MIYYIAFSIHGTNCFISASIEGPEVDGTHSQTLGTSVFFNGRKFKIVSSRRDGFDVKKETKLHSDKLLTKTGTPIKSAPLVLKFFNQLNKEGWELHNKQAFIDKHWKKK